MLACARKYEEVEPRSPTSVDRVTPPLHVSDLFYRLVPDARDTQSGARAHTHTHTHRIQIQLLGVLLLGLLAALALTLYNYYEACAQQTAQPLTSSTHRRYYRRVKCILMN